MTAKFECVSLYRLPLDEFYYCRFSGVALKFPPKKCFIQKL